MIATTEDRLQGRRLTAARVIWLLVATLVVALVAATLPDILLEASTVAPAEERTFSQLSPAEIVILEQLGLSVGAYAAFVLAWMLSPVLVFALVAGVIFLQRSDDAVAFIMSLKLLAIGAAVLFLGGITEFRPALQMAVHFVRALGVLLLLSLLFVFPDGRFVPAWTRGVAAVWAGWMVFWLLVPHSPVGLLDYTGALTPIGMVLILLGFGLGAYAQVYRYRHISNSIQRQQAKVFAFGFTGAFLIYMVAVIPYFLLPAVRQSGWPYLWYGLIFVPVLTRMAFALVPLMIGFAILRYRLWDIDLIIRRTLVYTVLTGALALIYVVTVISSQQLLAALTGRQQSELPTMLSTLAIAALFGPLRGRIQRLIDHRFYRHKYDSAQALAEFSHKALDEVDVGRLTDQLVRVIEQTLQPAHVSLWLKVPATRPLAVEQAAFQTTGSRAPGPSGQAAEGSSGPGR